MTDSNQSPNDVAKRVNNFIREENLRNWDFYPKMQDGRIIGFEAKYTPTLTPAMPEALVKKIKEEIAAVGLNFDENVAVRLASDVALKR